MLSNYHGSRCLDPGVSGPGQGKNFDCIVSPLKALTLINVGGSVTGAQGCDVASNDTSKIAAAVAVAKSADFVILTMGIDQSQEREGLDRTITTLPGVQSQLVDQVLAAKQNKNVVMVLFSGGAMSLGSQKDTVPAIISANYGGQAGATALAEVLFGDYNPTGKLAATMYPPEYISQINLTQMSVTTEPGRTHMFYSGKPEFAFASGLSYTSWSMRWNDIKDGYDSTIEWSLQDVRDEKQNQSVQLEIVLTNSGAMDGLQTVLLFWRPIGDNHSIKHLRQKLIGYAGAKESIKIGKSMSLKFEVSLSSLGLYRDQSFDEADPVVAIGEYELFASTGGSETALLTRTIQVTA